MDWTDERVEKLKTLWAEGLSANQIAAALGGVSRNAVIGKVHKLGLKAGNAEPAGRAMRRRGRIFADGTPSFDGYEETVDLARATNHDGATTVKTAEALLLAHRVFGDAAKARLWLMSPNPLMDGKAPFDLLQSEGGIIEVEQALLRIDHGIYV